MQDKWRVIACAVAAGVFITRASDVPASVRPGFDAIKASDLKADLTFVASDALEGRLSLTRGSEVAIQWIQSEFAKAGLKTAASERFLQPVPLWEYRTNREADYLKVQRAGSEETVHFPDAFGQFPEKVDVSAPVVFAGFGITAPELEYDDYKAIDAKNKIVLIFDHEPQETDAKSIFNGRGNTRYATARVKVLNAQAHGALAVLIVAEPNRKHLSNQERIAKTGSPQQRNRILSEAIIGDAVHIPYMTVSDKVAAELMMALNTTPSDLQKRIDTDLTTVSRDIPGTTVTVHLENSQARQGRSYNVAGLLEGSDPSLAGETIVISGHFDHDGASGDQIWHGADDNGSGTVGVVELARAFANNPERPKRSILFVVFAAEERGLLGSYYYVQHPLRPLETTRAVINFDMIGRNETPSAQTNGVIEIAPDTSNELNLIGTNYTPDYRRTVERENQTIGLHLNYKWDQDSSLNVFFRSDQFPFALHGIPAIWWFTGFHPDYHQPTDTADKINYSKMEKILKLAYLSAWSFSNEAPPKFNLRTDASTY
ncbi:MAG: M28 family peptidase [Acidobacteriaceae bacterium]|nr:M28 family peptidase [Acidobacteriaceae bacterium]